MYVCAIFRDEAEYIEEWLQWYRHLGVTHFFLYDNESSDNGVERAAAADVTVFSCPGTRVQCAAYMHCCQHVLTGDDTWTAFVDIDEYIYDGLHRHGLGIDTLLRIQMVYSWGIQEVDGLAEAV